MSSGFTGSKGNNRQNVTEFEYDKNNRLIEQRVVDANGAPIQKVQMGYDQAGRKAYEIDGEGNGTDYTYDDAGQLTQELYASINGEQHHKDFTYDANGNKATEEDEEGNTTKWIYDDGNRLWKVIDPRHYPSETEYTEYVYDNAGNKTQQIDLEGHTTYFYYDEMNRLVKTYYPDNPPSPVEDPTNVASEEEVYDNNGNRTEKKTKNGDEQDTTTYTYDERNRVATITYPGSGSADVTYEYDYAGNRVSMVDEHGTTTYEHDVRSRLTKETKAQGWVLEYDYDLAGNKVQFTLTVNSSVSATTYTYDEANRLKTVTDPDEGTSTYTYDKVGNRQSLSYPNGVVAEYTYNARNWLVDLHNHKGETTISRHQYTHYNDGNRKTLSDATRDYSWVGRHKEYESPFQGFACCGAFRFQGFAFGSPFAIMTRPLRGLTAKAAPTRVYGGRRRSA